MPSEPQQFQWAAVAKKLADMGASFLPIREPLAGAFELHIHADNLALDHWTAKNDDVFFMPPSAA